MDSPRVQATDRYMRKWPQPNQEGLPCRMQMGTPGRDLALWQAPNQEGLHNSPPAGKDPSK
jgi:hypothetical protein